MIFMNSELEEKLSETVMNFARHCSEFGLTIGKITKTSVGIASVPTSFEPGTFDIRSRTEKVRISVGGLKSES
jgi:hypothetical protein